MHSGRQLAAIKKYFVLSEILRPNPVAVLEYIFSILRICVELVTNDRLEFTEIVFSGKCGFLFTNGRTLTAPWSCELEEIQ